VIGTSLVITKGQRDTRHALTDALLFADLVSMATPVVKWAREISRADQIPVLIRRAFHDCNAAPTGPVFLSLPMDVMEQMTSPRNPRGPYRNEGNRPAREEVRKVLCPMDAHVDQTFLIEVPFRSDAREVLGDAS